MSVALSVALEDVEELSSSLSDALRIHFKTATVLTLKSLAIPIIETPWWAYKITPRFLKSGETPLGFVLVN